MLGLNVEGNFTVFTLQLFITFRLN